MPTRAVAGGTKPLHTMEFTCFRCRRFASIIYRESFFTDHLGSVEVGHRRTRPMSLRVHLLFPCLTDSGGSNRTASRPTRKSRQVRVMEIGFRPKGSTQCRCRPAHRRRQFQGGTVSSRASRATMHLTPIEREADVLMSHSQTTMCLHILIEHFFDFPMNPRNPSGA